MVVSAEIRPDAHALKLVTVSVSARNGETALFAAVVSIAISLEDYNHKASSCLLGPDGIHHMVDVTHPENDRAAKYYHKQASDGYVDLVVYLEACDDKTGGVHAQESLIQETVDYMETWRLVRDQWQDKRGYCHRKVVPPPDMAIVTRIYSYLTRYSAIWVLWQGQE